MTSTTIQLDKDVVQELKNIRDFPRQTYNELLQHMITVYKATKQKNQYDEFLHKVQQSKMNELWGSKEDDVWDTV